MKSRFIGPLIGAVAALVLATVFHVHPALAMLPIAFGTLLSDDNFMKLMIANGLYDSNGISYQPRRHVVETVTASRTLSVLDSGKTFLVGAADVVFTLPAAAAGTKGCRFYFILLTAGLSAGTGMSLSPAAADFVTSTGLTAVVDKDLVNSGASDAQGDSAEITCDGSTGWFGRVTGTWAKQA